MFLTFSIPTWNRADQLRACVESIAPQLKEDMGILIQDHGSDDHTPEVIAELEQKYPFVRHTTLQRGQSPDYSHAFRALFASSEGTWTWTFGDDDKLLEGSVEKMLPALKREELFFIHVAERKRAAHTGGLHSASLLDLCNNYGLLDMTGFITGNIVRSHRLVEAAKLPSWDIYAKSAFVQSLALLEVCRGDKAAFLDWPIVDSQDAEQNEETRYRWTLFDIPTRYFHLIEGLEDMKGRGIVNTVNSAFFRYLSYYLWDRFIQNIISSFTTTQEFKVTDMLHDLFVRTVRLTDLLPSMEAKRYRAEIVEVREALENYSFSLSQAFSCQATVDRLLNAHGVERFPFEYLKPRALQLDNAFIDAQIPAPVGTP